MPAPMPWVYRSFRLSSSLDTGLNFPSTSEVLLGEPFHSDDIGTDLHVFLDLLHDGVERETTGQLNELRIALEVALDRRSQRSLVDVQRRAGVFAHATLNETQQFRRWTGDDTASIQIRLDIHQAAAGFGDAANRLAYLLSTAHLREELDTQTARTALLRSQGWLAVAHASYEHEQQTLQPSEVHPDDRIDAEAVAFAGTQAVFDRAFETAHRILNTGR